MKKLISYVTLCTLALGMSVSAQRRAPGEVNLVTNFYASPMSTFKGNMVRLPLQAGKDPVILSSSGDIDATWGGFFKNGKYYATSQWQVTPTAAYSTVKIYNASTWALEQTNFNEDNSKSILASAVSYNEKDKRVYGCYIASTQSGVKYEFGVGNYDTATPNHTRLGDIDQTDPWSALASDADGTLYVITSKGNFGTVNRSSGVVTKLGTTGVTSQALSSAVIDSKSGRMFWTVNNPTLSGLYEINKQTGAATLLYTFPGTGSYASGLYVAAPLAADKAPEVVSNLSLDFPDGALSGTVNFTMPSTLFDGTAISGNLEYTITANDAILATGTAAAGQSMKVKASVKIATDYVITVFTSNSAGESPRAEAKMFIGNGTPVQPKNVKFAHTAGKASLSWDAVKLCENSKGNFKPTEITYTVTRFPDGIVVSQGSGETSFTESLPIPDVRKEYYYSVKAVFRDMTSTPGESNRIALGALPAPWSSNFKTGFGDVKTIDGNNDGQSWITLSDCAAFASFMSGAAGTAMDEWLVSPALSLSKDDTYIFSVGEHFMPMFGATEASAPYVSLYMGRGDNIEDLTTLLMEPVKASITTKGVHEFTINPTESGNYFFALRATAEKGNFFYVDYMKVLTGNIPGPVTDLTATPAADCSYSATISFKAPAVDVAGRPLKSLARIDLSRAGVHLASFSKPEPGKEYTFVDDKNFYGPGNYQWVVDVFGEGNTQGASASVVAYMGVPILGPQPPIHTSEEGNTGKVTFTWEPSFFSAAGNPVDPKHVVFDIINRGQYIVRDLPSDTRSYTFQAVEEGGQTFVQGNVCARTFPGSSSALGELLVVGTPYRRYFNSFSEANPGPEYELSDSREFARWGRIDDGMLEGITSSDADGSCVGIVSETPGAGSTMLLGKFDLNGMSHPSLVFDLYHTAIDDNNLMSIILTDQNGNKARKEFIVGSAKGAEQAWSQVTVDLSDQKDKVVLIEIDGKIVNYPIILMDRLKFMDVQPVNLSAGKLSGPSFANTGIAFRLTAAVENNGAEKSGEYMLRLIRNGEVVDSITAPSVDPGKTAYSTFEQTASSIWPAMLEYSFEIVCAADGDASDNISPVTSFRLRLPSFPAPQSLSATDAGNGSALLTWAEPTTSAGQSLSLYGFNVYRNGKKINQALVEDTQYLDAEAGTNDPAYFVTAVYDLGESVPCEAVHIQQNGLSVPEAARGIVVRDKHIYMTAPGTVYAADGRCVYMSKASSHSVELPAGVYMVSTAGRTVKVIVK